MAVLSTREDPDSSAISDAAVTSPASRVKYNLSLVIFLNLTAHKHLRVTYAGCLSFSVVPEGFPIRNRWWLNQPFSILKYLWWVLPFAKCKHYYTLFEVTESRVEEAAAAAIISFSLLIAHRTSHARKDATKKHNVQNQSCKGMYGLQNHCSLHFLLCNSL